MATAGQAANHLFMSERNFHTLLNEGAIERQERDGYDLEIVREEYILHLRDSAAGRKKKVGKLDGEYERARKDKELADRTALQNAVTRGELISAADAGAAWTAMQSNARERLLAMPAKLSDRCALSGSPSEIYGLIEDEVHAALDELADVTVYAAEPESSEGDDTAGQES